MQAPASPKNQEKLPRVLRPKDAQIEHVPPARTTLISTSVFFNILEGKSSVAGCDHRLGQVKIVNKHTQTTLTSVLFTILTRSSVTFLINIVSVGAGHHLAFPQYVQYYYLIAY